MGENFLSLIKMCRSVRAYKSESVPSKALDAVLEAGTYAPTGGGHQSPTIIAITDSKYRRKIAKLNAEVMVSNTDPYYGAPVVTLVLADGSASTYVEDGSAFLKIGCLLLMHLAWKPYGFIVNVRFLTAKVVRICCGSGSYRKPCVASERLHWVIQPRKPVNPQHANKTILFGQFVEKRESMQTNNKMAVAPVGKLIWQMSIPPLISMFLQYSYNLIDSAFVARLSENALTAVSLSFPITTLMNATSIWIGVGVNVLIAGYLGEKKQDDANTTVTHGLLLAFGIGALLNLLSLLIMKPYFGAFTNNEEIYQLSLAYMSVCSFMQIPNMVHIAIQKMIQATGNMIAPMWFQIAGVIVNFVFDPLLIFGIGVFPAMGIRGAAVATVAGYFLSMILAFALLLGKKQKVRIKIKEFHIQKRMIARIFALGLPSFIMNALSSFMVTFVNLFLVAYSDTAIAFFGAYFKVQQLIVMTVNGLIQGCLPIMRFNYGAGNRDRLHSAFRYGTALVSGMMILGTLTVNFFPAQLLELFTASEAMRSFGISAMRIMAASYLFCGLSTMISTYFQATEKVGSSIAIQLCRQLLFLVPALWCLNKLFQLNGIWLAFPVAETATMLIALIIMAWHRHKNIL